MRTELKDVTLNHYIFWSEYHPLKSTYSNINLRDNRQCEIKCWCDRERETVFVSLVTDQWIE